MSAEQEEPFILIRRRSFSEVFDDLGCFVREHSAHFFKAVAWIPGPFLVLTGIVSIYLGLLTPSGMSLTETRTVLAFLLVLFLSLCSTLLLIGTTVAYFKGMEEERGRPTVRYVRRRVFRNLGVLINTFLAWLGIVLAFSFGAGIALAFFSFVVGAAGGAFLIPFMIFLGFLLLYPPIVHLASASFFGVLHHGFNFGKAFSKAWRSLRMAFWRNWGVVFIGTLLFFFLSFSCMVPEGIFVGFYRYFTLDPIQEGMSHYIYTGIAFFRFLATQFLWTLLLALLGMNYYSLHEVDSGETLLQRYERIATSK